jgi:putative lipoprotein
MDRQRHLASALLAAALLLGACAGKPPLPDPQALEAAPAAATPIDGIDWHLEQLAGQWIILADVSQSPFVRFDGSRRQLSGFDGCNRLSGPLRLLGTHLRIGPLASTRKACPPSMAPEREFVAAIEGAVHWQRQGDRLELRAAGGEPLLLLRAGR